MNKLKFQKQKGFTLIELMIAMFIGLLVFGGVFVTFKNQKLLYSRQEKTIKINQDTRAALSLIKRYVRKAGVSVADCSYDNPSRVCTGLEYVDPNALGVSFDSNLDGAVTTTDNILTSEKIYFLRSSDFREGTATSLYICPNNFISDKCSFILDNVSKFEVAACEKGNNCSSVSYKNADSVEVILQAETKDIEITEDNQKLKGQEIKARVFFINKVFQ